MTNRVASLASISIDCPDPDALAPFDRGLLGLEEAFATPDRGVVAPSGAGPMLTLMRVEAYEPPAWPDGPQFQQMHLDLAAEDLDADVAATVKLGARQAQHQPAPEMWRVMLDPVGHLFGLSAARPD